MPDRAGSRDRVETKTQTGAETKEAPSGGWQQTVAGLNLNGMALQLASNCTLIEQTEHSVSLLLDKAHSHLCSSGTEKKLAEALQAFLGRPVKLEIHSGRPEVETPAAAVKRQQADRQREAERAIENDSTVRGLREKFNARVVPDSVQPAD